MVRYARRKYAEHGDRLPDDIRWAVRTKIAHALSGGYDERARHLPQATRVMVRELDAGRCVLCGDPGREIDHIDGPSGDLANLRLLCEDCHHQITASRFVPIDDAETQGRANWLRVRISVPDPIRACGSVTWGLEWQTWLVEHRQPPGN